MLCETGKKLLVSDDSHDMMAKMAEYSVEKHSSIWWPKLKFFLYRFITYFSFLLVPILTPKAVDLPLWARGLFMVLYILFIVGQWFLLGKEIDHKIQIYFQTTSTMDRVIYRIYLGMFSLALYFNLLTFFSHKWIYNSFWVTWVVLGLFYSWPTRGKIIQESVTTHFSELKYLDGQERTLLVIILIMLIVTLLEFPIFHSPSTLKLYYDPANNISFFFWNFLTVNYYPFLKFPQLLNIAWGLHFYFVGVGLYLLTFYALLRMFVSRRISILGVFALLSSWSVTKILISSPGNFLTHSFSLLWIWTVLWAIKSSTYKSGLFLGLVSFWGSVMSKIFLPLHAIQLIILYSFLSKKTPWFRKQLLKYTFSGIVLTIIIFLFDLDMYEKSFKILTFWPINFDSIFFRKSFFLLAPLGLFLLLIKIYPRTPPFLVLLKINQDIIKQFFLCSLAYYTLCFIFNMEMGGRSSLLWIVTLLSLIPVELIFQSIKQLRPTRNFIYFAYILICLLDSYFEERLKLFLKIFY